MASPKRKEKVTEAALDTSVLQRIADASVTDGFGRVSLTEAEPLLKYPAGALIEVDGSNTDANGNIAARLTPAGSALVTVAETDEGDGFEIDEGIAFEVGARTRTAQSIYPFDKLAAPKTVDTPNGSQVVYASFHIAPSAAHPNPAKSLASTIASATSRSLPKQFRILEAKPNDPKGKGARVFRLADFTDEELAERKKNSDSRSQAHQARLAAMTDEEKVARAKMLADAAAKRSETRAARKTG